MPWLNSDQYFYRRSVATPSEDRIRVYRSQWLDLENPGGGLSTDISSMMRDMAAQDADLATGTTSQPQGGSHLHVGQHDVPAMELQTTFDQSCSGPTCSGIVNLTSTAVTVTASSSVQEWNNGMYSANTLGTGQRQGMVVDDKGVVVSEPVDVDLGGVRKSSLPDQSGTTGTYGQRSQADLDSNEFSVTLMLDPDYREDFRWDGGGLGENLIMRRFGSPRFRMTYKGYGVGRVRFLGYNEPGEPIREPIDQSAHVGYRQPSLSRAFHPGTAPITSASVSHIRWPVDLQDLHWYLYQLPGEYRVGDVHWMFWLDGDAVRKLVNGGYGQSADPLTGLTTPDCDLQGQVLVAGKIGCVVPDADDLDKLRQGEVTGVYFPFDTDDGSVGLERGMLVRQGVESPQEADGEDVRPLSVFQFDVKEQEPMGRATESGAHAEARYGVPPDPDSRKDYLDGWPGEKIYPNRSYLMVVTYYESYDSGEPDEGGITFENAVDGSKIRLPKRYIRRVVCRLMVSPSGFTPAGEEGGGPFGWLNWAKDNVLQAVGKGLEVISGWLSSVLRAVISFPGWGVKQGGALACGGLSKVDELTAEAAGARGRRGDPGERERRCPGGERCGVEPEGGVR